jgi:hypothetical protein
MSATVYQLPAPKLPLRLRLWHKIRPPTPAGTPGVDRPELVRDQPFWKKWFVIRPQLYLIAAIGGYIAFRTYAGVYHDATGLTAAQNNAYHNLFSSDWIRHLIVRDATEKAYVFTTIQVIVYNFATHWPRKAASKFDRAGAKLGIASSKIDVQGIPTIIVSSLLWLPIFFLPGELAFAGLLKLGGANEVHPPNWQISAIGLAGSLFFGRRIAKGIAFHFQRIFIKERLETQSALGRDFTPAWWMPWPMRSRFRWTAASWDRSRVNKVWEHRRLQLFVRRLPSALLVAGFIFLTVQGALVLHNYSPIA